MRLGPGRGRVGWKAFATPRIAHKQGAGGPHRCGPLQRLLSEGQPQSEAELALVDTLARLRVGSGHHQEFAVGEASLWLAEMGRVGEVERLGAELDLDPLRDRELTEDAEVPVGNARPVQDVKPIEP